MSMSDVDEAQKLDLQGHGHPFAKSTSVSSLKIRSLSRPRLRVTRAVGGTYA
jgi:hypothetical protein